MVAKRMMNLFSRELLIVVCAFAAAFAMACGSSSGGRPANANANSDAQPAVTITVAKSESRSVGATINATGSLTADESSNVAPKTAGKLTNVTVNEGQYVAQGTVIARIDDHDARLQLASAVAAVRQAKAGVAQAEAKLGLLGGGKFSADAVPEVRAAKANFDQANFELKQAEANEKRYRELTETGDVAMITYEQYRTARDTARSKANASKQQLETVINTARQSNQAIVSAMANVDAAQTQVANAQRSIDDTVIRAPFSGFVSSRPVAVGEFVSSASVVATILRTNPMKAQIQVAEADVPFISIGRGVSLQVDAYKDRNFSGTVSAVNPAIDPASRAAVVEAKFENDDNALRQGMFVTVKITREGGTNGVFVPKSAVYNDKATQSYRVFVIVDGVAKLRVVQLGTEEADWQQILTGVNGDETVATSNIETLYEGAKVSF